MNRRDTLLGLLALGAATSHSIAQPPLKIRRVGFLSVFPRPASLEATFNIGAFLKAMRDLGWIEERNVAYEWRFADRKYDRLPGMAEDLAQSKVDVIVAATPPSIQAARKATTSIPIVMVAVGDPVALGFVASFAQPGGNITGVSNAIDDVSKKYLEMLRYVVPKLSRVAILVNPDNPNYLNILGQIRAAGKAMAIDITSVDARTPGHIAEGIGGLKGTRAEALIIQADGLFASQWREIADLATKNRMPTMFWTREGVEAGGLMSYGQNVGDDYRKAATFVSRILKGASPQNMPVEQPTVLKLTVNRKTANAFGLALPQELLLRADEIIE